MSGEYSEHGRWEMIKKEMDEITEQWKKSTPIYLATTSRARREGVINAGFNSENIHSVEVPNEVEVTALYDYLEGFQPSWLDPNGSVGMEAAAKSKADFLAKQGVPANAFWFAWDTLVVNYRPNEGEKKFGNNWRAETRKKPETIEQAQQSAKEMFLALMANYLNFTNKLKQKKLNWQDLDSNPTLKRDYQRMDFASGIHAKTAFAVRFPYEDDVRVESDRIIARPQRLYKLVDDLNIPEVPEMNNELLVKWLSEQKAPSGKTVGELVEEIIGEIFKAMSEEGVNPLGISGGVAYNLEKVKNILDIFEMPNILRTEFGSEEADQSIYTGFPKVLFKNMLELEALRMAVARVDGVSTKIEIENGKVV